MYVHQDSAIDTTAPIRPRPSSASHLQTLHLNAKCRLAFVSDLFDPGFSLRISAVRETTRCHLFAQRKLK